MKNSSDKSITEKFSIAALLAETFITSRLTPALILACVLLGAWSLYYTPRQDNPRIVIPAASISVELPGASAEEVEAQVVRPLEGAIKQIPGVDDVFATALHSKAQISVVFKAQENPETAIVRLYDRVGTRRDLLPPDASPVLIRSSSVDDVPILTVTLTSANYNDLELKRVADRLADGLRSLDDVGAIDVKGGQDKQARIELNPDQMRAYDVDLNRLQNALTANNFAQVSGEIVRANQRVEILVNGFIHTIEDLKNLPITTQHGRVLHLADIARVTDAPQPERSTVSRLAFGPSDERAKKYGNNELAAVTLAVAKKEKANAVTVSEQVLARIEEMKSKSVPPEIELVVTRDDGAFANDTVNQLIEHLLIAVLAVFLVITSFLGFRQAMIVGIAIPLVLAMTLGMIWLTGYSINRVTLFALILSLGLLVDDAIVVIENVHRNYGLSTNLDKRHATLIATQEIGNPTNLATLAVMFVFLSMLSVQGMSGQYFFPLAFTVPVAMACSLLIAYTVVPWAAYRWLPQHGHNAGAEQPGWLPQQLKRAVAPLLNSSWKRRAMLIGVLAGLGLSLLMPTWQFIRPAGVNGPQSWFGVEVGMMPKDSRNSFNITINMPETAPIENTDQLAREIGAVLRSYPEITHYQTWVGQSGIIDFNGMLRGAGNKSGPWVAEIRVNLSDRHSRQKKSAAIVLALRPTILAIAAKYPGASVQLVEDPPGPPVRANVLAEIYGHDNAKLRQFSQQVEQAFRSTWDMAEIARSETADVRRIVLEVDPEKAAASGLTVADIANELRRITSGAYLGRIHPAGELNIQPIELQVPRSEQIDFSMLSGTYLSNSKGQKIPLSAVVRQTEKIADHPILRKNGERVTYVSGETGSIMPLYAVLDISHRIANLQLDDGTELVFDNAKRAPVGARAENHYRLRWDGQQSQMIETYSDMLRALGVAICLLFLSFVAYYKSFSLPLIALAVIPLGVIGVAPGHLLLGQQFSATSLVGIIALAGVVVRNSLLIIDFVLAYLEQGKPLQDALLEACAVRFRPILLTALSIVLGGVVMLLDPVFVGLAISLIFGTIAATCFTLIVIPVLLFQLLRFKGIHQ